MMALLKSAIILTGLGFFQQVSAQTPIPPILMGPAFSNTEHIVSMPDKWENQPISRKNWAEGSDIAITLDQHLYPALLPLIKQFSNEKGLKIAVHKGTCGISAGKLKERQTDIGGFCCPAGKTDRLPGLKFHTLAIAPLALLVHPKNPLSNVSLDQARDLFQGKISRWGQLTGLDSGFNYRIRPIARLHCKIRPGHWRLLLNDENLFSSRTHHVSSISDMIFSVSTLKSSIGYEMLWMVKSNNRSVKALSINGYRPYDHGALLRGNYPLYRTYNITSWSQPPAHNPQVTELINYIYKHFDQVDPQYGFVPRSKLEKAGWKFNENELYAAPTQPL